MDKIILSADEKFSIAAYLKGSKVPAGLKPLPSFTLENSPKTPFALYAADDVPVIYYAPKQGLFGGATLSKEASLNEELKTKLHTLMVQYNLEGKDLYAFIGPSLTFSHVPVERKVLEDLMERGYRAAAKRCDGVDFFDVPMMNVIQLRGLGLPFDHILIDAHDTFECADILYSQLRGDKEKNPIVIELL
jgi:copper oxidase (laccase) domain-containing protein